MMEKIYPPAAVESVETRHRGMLELRTDIK